MRAAGSFCCHKEIFSGGEPIAYRESHAIPYSFGSDDATHLLSWNDLSGRSEGEDLYHRREASIARV